MKNSRAWMFAFASLLAGGLTLALRKRSSSVDTLPSSSALPTRASVVNLARSELGSGTVERYWSGVLAPGQSKPPGVTWCGAFALWVLRELGLTSWTYDDAGAWFYGLPWTADPKPGDLAFLEDRRHLAIVGAVHEDGTVELINGAGTGNVVTTSTLQRGRVTEYRSIAPLLAA